MALIIEDKVSSAAQKDILELRDKIDRFNQGQEDEERFKLFRLARGVYGQRQQGVQMFRLKIPYGKLTGNQLVRIAELSEEYSNGNLHATTRQNFQLHYIKLEDTPQMWARLEEEGVTTREACGNTVRNITASAHAGIDPHELFDVVPYVDATFNYFLRNPICQQMGRKVKIAFSSSDQDSALTYIHDFGFIPRIKDGEKGFKVVVGGGLGAQAILAKTAYEFLPANKLLPFIEAGIRIFDRYGEREKRHKARLKFLLDEKRGIGLQGFLDLIEKEWIANANQTLEIPYYEEEIPSDYKQVNNIPILEDKAAYENWLATNVVEQKQKGLFAVQVKLPLGNISAETTKAFVEKISGYVADDIRVTINQGLLLRHAPEENLPYIYSVLKELNLADPGFDSIADITACPGTDTCNLAVTNSTAISLILEDILQKEYPELVRNSEIRIKISGCMNACGQHMIAQIGFHGSSIKHGNLVVPALQVVLGGGVAPNGEGFIAEKVIKLPSKRIPDALRALLNDYKENSNEGEYFNEYFLRNGKMYFYGLLKPLAALETLHENDYSDWGKTELYTPEIGVGECAGVTLDVVSTILGDAEEKVGLAKEAITLGRWADSVYHSYSAFVVAAKALLLSKDHHCNTHIKIISDFEEKFVKTGEVNLNYSFEEKVLEINKREADQSFAEASYIDAGNFVSQITALRKLQTSGAEINEDKQVISSFYNA
ncbi:MAG: HEPN domain-containing protein [Bacteroidota bacterium]